MEDSPVLTPVREAHEFDRGALGEYLNQHLEGNFENMGVQQFEGGQSNPTYRIDAGKHNYVLRKKPSGVLLKSAHQVEREYRVQTALHDCGVPVPKTYLLCEDESVIGQPFYVMEMVAGRVITDPNLPNMNKDERAALYDQFAKVLVALHTVDYEAVGLAGFGRPGNYFARQISRWSKQYAASKTIEDSNMEALVEWLPENIPEGDEATIVHGDYRIGNLIIHPVEPRILAVLDWELSTVGHPLGDVGYACLGYHLEEPLGGPDTGIPTEEESVQSYCRIAGREPIENWPFYVIYNLFRTAAIVQGVFKRGLDGNASSQDSWKDFERSARVIAAHAWNLVESK
jgi:aminoglycoside phosphotransferase (APT) family kinase protein